MQQPCPNVVPAHVQVADEHGLEVSLGLPAAGAVPVSAPAQVSSPRRICGKPLHKTARYSSGGYERGAQDVLCPAVTTAGQQLPAPTRHMLKHPWHGGFGRGDPRQCVLCLQAVDTGDDLSKRLAELRGR